MISVTRGLGSLALLALAAIPIRADKPKVIIDQDGAGASVQMVVEDPTVEVLGITEVTGDAWVKEEVATTLRMLESIGRPESPVFTGATSPLVNSQEEDRVWEKLYGPLTWKGAWMEKLPDYDKTNVLHYHGPDVIPVPKGGMPTIKAATEPAAAFLVRQAREFPGQITILAMGPFTNLALAQRLDPDFAKNCKELIIMGGSFNPYATREDFLTLQFLHSPRTEFNCRFDPEAVKIMLHAGWKKITVVPFDPCVDTVTTPELLKRASSSGTKGANYAALTGVSGFPLWDEGAAAMCLDPTVAKKTKQVLMDIDIGHGANYGSILSWPVGRGPDLGEPVVTVVDAFDLPKLQALYVKELNR